LNRSILDWDINTTFEKAEKEDETPINPVSASLVKFFTVFGIQANKKGTGIPLLGMEEKGVRLLIISSHCKNELKEYFKQLIFQAYSIHTMDLTRQRYIFMETESSSKAWRFDRFFHVMASIFKHLKIGLKLQADKLLTIFSPGLGGDFLDMGEPGTITNRELRNSIEETCFATGVEEMREFLLRDTAIFHDLIFKKLGIGNNEDNRNENDIKIRKSAVRLIFGAWLAGDIDKDLPGRVLKEFSGEFLEKNELIEGLNDKIKDLNNIHFRFKNPLWKYLENRKIAFIEDRSEIEKEGWDIVLPAIFRSPEQLKPVELVPFENVNKALDIFKYNKEGMELTDFDLIILDLYSSDTGGNHGQSIQITNMKDPLWQLIEMLDDIRKGCIEKSIPQPMPHIIVFTRDDKGITVRTMFKELNAADYFFKITEAEEHKCGYYSSFRNAVLSALKENVYQVGGMTDIPSRLHFNKWLRQFDPCDRPLILHLMKHYKYFPAANIVKLFDIYLNLKENTKWNKNGTVSILNSSPRKPDRFYISYLGRPNKSGPATLPLLSKTGWIIKLREEIEKRNLKKIPGFFSYEDLKPKIKNRIKRGTLKKNPLCLIFVDDVVGSGGQLDDYIKKFIKYLIKNTAEEKLTQLQSLEIIVLFALGIQKDDFESLINNKGGGRIGNEAGSIKGTFEVEVNDGFFIPISVHVAHYTRSIREIFKNNLMAVEKTLKKYSVSMELRDEDYPCDFLPLGWEENGGLISTYANIPGNTIPVIWQEYKSKNKKDMILRENGLSLKEWVPLHQRYFNPLTTGKKRNKRKLECFIKKVCLVDSEKWNERFFAEHWGKENNSDPPCKIKS
jgi:hypothetical protein